MNPTLGCLSGHMLNFTNKPNNPTNQAETFTCDACSKTNYIVAGCWICYHCNYFICTNCRKAPYRNFVCPTGHVLMWTTPSNLAPGSNVSCNNCNGSCNAWGNYWSCALCSFNICVYCKREPYSQATCPTGHPLGWSTQAYANSDGSFECKQCLSLQYSNTGRWSCAICMFDICNACKTGGSSTGLSQPAPPQSYPSQPIAPRPAMSQPSYPQQYSPPQSTYTAPPPYAVSQQVYATQPQVYAIPQPTYPNVRPVYGVPATGVVPQGTPQSYSAPRPKGMRCAKSHPLLLSKTNVGYPDSIYTCAYCGGQFSCLVQRWHCSTCKYNVCKSCLIP